MIIYADTTKHNIPSTEVLVVASQNKHMEINIHGSQVPARLRPSVCTSNKSFEFENYKHKGNSSHCS